MSTLLIEALKGAQAEVVAQQGLLQQLRRAGKLTGILAQELRAAVGLSPFGIRAVRVRSALAAADNPDASPYGVVLHQAVRYGPLLRHLLDIYVPSKLQQQLSQQEQQGQQQGQLPQQQQQQQEQQQGPLLQQQQQPQQQQQVPVVFFVHGGIWVTGERWHFCPLATSLAQAGLVVVVPSYTLYPDALAGQMAAEVLAAYKWTAQHVTAYGGDPHNITVMGHSAGGHLGSLALLMLAQQKHTAAMEQLPMHTAAMQQQEHAAGQQQQQQQTVDKQQQPQLQQLQQQQQGVRHLPDLQLQQRAELTAAEALHHHHHHNTTHPLQGHAGSATQQQQGQHELGLTPQQQHATQAVFQQQQQQQQQQEAHWADASADYLLSIPTPAAFVGMSCVYDVARHFEFESMRGVAGISTMARACGGAVNFDAISPAVILRQAAAAAATAAAFGGASSVGSSNGSCCCGCPCCDSCRQDGQTCSSSSNSGVQGNMSEAGGSRCMRHPLSPQQQQQRQQELQQQQHQQPEQQQQLQQHQQRQKSQHHQQQQLGSVLLGEVIPFRSGLDGGAAAAHAHNSSSHHQQQQQPPHNAAAGGSSAAVSCPASAVLGDFRAAAAARFMPPCVLMSSLADHMVPWHEASEMFLALRSCGVPAKQLIYDRALHNDFVLDWSPMKATAGGGVAAAATAVAGNGGTAVTSNGSSSGGNALKSSSGNSSISGESRLVGAAHFSSSSSSSAEQLPAFARDLFAILLGRVQLRYEMGSSERTAAAVAAIERAAGLPQLQQQPPRQQRGLGQGNVSASGGVPAAAGEDQNGQRAVPGPMSRL